MKSVAHWSGLALAVAASFAIVGALTGAAVASEYGAARVVTAHVFLNSHHDAIVAWRLTDRRVALTFQDDTSTIMVVRGRTLMYVSQGVATEIVRYHFGGLWRVVGERFGITRYQLAAAMKSDATAQRLQSPLEAQRQSTTGAPPPTTTKVDDYGVNVFALARAAPFAIKFAGDSVLGYRLADVNLSSLTNPFRNTFSGLFAALFYSTDPSHLGARDHEITLNLSDQSSHYGQVNAQFLGGGRPSVSSRGLKAYKANPNQIVLRIGSVIAVATSTLILPDSSWQKFLLSLRSP